MAVRDELHTLIDGALEAGLGSAIALSIGDGRREVHRRCRGSLWRAPSPGPAISDDPWFDLASLTKPICTVTLAMIFVERGLLALETPARTWVPDAATPATLAQLLGHAAGCAAHVKFYEDLAARTLAGETPRQALLRAARQHPLAGTPGETTAYSDLGYILLGELLERVGRAPLDELFTAHVAAPLGLGCHFRPEGGPARPEAGDAGAPSEVGDSRDTVATELDADGLIVGRVHDENARAGGGVFGHAGLFGRVSDVARFARATLAAVAGDHADGALVSPEVAGEFFARAPGAASWRLGWDTPSPTPGVSHAGDRWPRASGVGHLGFTGTSLWLDLARGRWCALLTNRVHPSRDGSADGIKQLRRAVMDAAWRYLEEREG
jgi:serine-type D-Ala-D-Ala carboxypeptidase